MLHFCKQSEYLGCMKKELSESAV